MWSKCDPVKIKTERVYLSLGEKEPLTRKPVMSTVGEKMEEAYGFLKDNGIFCIFEWNQGNHFADVGLRTAKAFTWVLEPKKSFEII